MNPFTHYSRHASDVGLPSGLSPEFGFSHYEGSIFGKHHKSGKIIQVPTVVNDPELGPLYHTIGAAHYSLTPTIYTKSNAEFGGTPKESLIPFTEHYINKVFSKNNNSFSAIKESSSALLNRSRSVLLSSLGEDFSLAFMRSSLIDVNELEISVNHPKFGGTRTVAEHIKTFNALKDELLKSGGRQLVQRQAAVDDFYSSLVQAIEGKEVLGKKVYISSIKDKMFREEGVVSTHSPTFVSANVTPSLIGKGLHGQHKITGVRHKLVKHLGLTTPTLTGEGFNKEVVFYNKLNKRFGGKRSNLVTRFSGTTAYLDIESSQALGLADSYSIGGKEHFKLFSDDLKDPLGFDRRVKELIIGDVTDYDKLDIAEPIKADAIEILKGNVPKGMKKSSGGVYYYDPTPGESLPRLVDGFVGKHANVLATSKDALDIGRATLNTAGNYPEILGYELGGKGGRSLKIIYNKGRKLAGRTSDGPFVTRAIISGGTRYTQTAYHNLTMVTGSGGIVDQAMRAMDSGIKGGVLKDEFLSRYMQHLAAVARSNKKLSEFAGFMNASGAGFGISPSGKRIFYRDTKSAFGTPIVAPIQALLSLNESELTNIGLSREAIKHLELKDGKLALSSNALEDIIINDTANVKTRTVRGIVLQGADNSLRSGYVNKMRIGRGALKLRMHDMLIASQENGGSLPNAMKELISRGKSGTALRELALIAESSGGYNKDSPLFKKLLGHIQNRSLDSSDFIHINDVMGLSGSMDQTLALLRSGHPLTEEMLRGTVHGAEFGPKLVRLPKAFSFSIGGRKQVDTNILPILSDTFLGSTGHEGGKFLSSRGLRNLGLPAMKAKLFTLLTEHRQDIMSGAETQGVKDFYSLASKFMTSIYVGMPGKKGLIYQNLVGMPNASFYAPIIVPTQSANYLDLNPRDARKLLKRAGYSRKQIRNLVKSGLPTNIYAGVKRDPVHRGQNLNSLMVRIRSDIAEGSVGIPEVVAKIGMGDYDKDAFSGFILQKGDTELEDLFVRQVGFRNAYNNIIQSEDRALHNIQDKISKGVLSTGYTLEELGKIDPTETILSKVSSRLGSAAGGGVYVGPVHMAWARLNAVNSSLNDQFYDEFLKSQGDDELLKKLSQLRGDKTFNEMLGLLQETGVYGVLKKESGGFGTKETAAITALLDLGEGRISANQARSIFEAGFDKAADSGQLIPNEYLLNKGGSQVDNILDILFNQNHGGLETLSILMHKLRKAGMHDNFYELARGQVGDSISSELLSKKQTSVGYSLLGDAYDQLPDATVNDELMDQYNEITSHLTDKAETHGKTVLEEVAEVNKKVGIDFDSLITKGHEFIKSPWGKRAALGLGAVFGIAAIDSMTSDDDNTVRAAGAPLPPRANVSYPDTSSQTPNVSSFKARVPGRVERPYGTRHQYNINVNTNDSSDFSSINHVIGTVGGALPGHSTVTDRTDRDADSQYYIRQRLRSSF